MSSIVLVGIGGFLGACGRYLCSRLVNRYWRGSFPLAIFLINMLGSFLLGCLVSHSVSGAALGEEITYGLGIGFLGAFTTFSTFEFEVLQLIENRKAATAGLYVISSFVLGFALAWLASGLF